jgi:hypothetical protein
VRFESGAGFARFFTSQAINPWLIDTTPSP